ncbi:hypothetical protein Y1Q_0009511 [Alligator mississippiensis]|uniref:Uncharacterized protein n=1 Tax=Alligator mississippiensis TaxID=8496 RepID=A0A151NUC4_ALLMI|nr:hypothetical protein Y1Q_0009511 [Alligator mississippiensis]
MLFGLVSVTKGCSLLSPLPRQEGQHLLPTAPHRQLCLFAGHGHWVQLDTIADGEPHAKRPALPALDTWATTHCWSCPPAVGAAHSLLELPRCAGCTTSALGTGPSCSSGSWRWWRTG